jgi:hypothetical protein
VRKAYLVKELSESFRLVIFQKGENPLIKEIYGLNSFKTDLKQFLAIFRNKRARFLQHEQNLHPKQNPNISSAED